MKREEFVQWAESRGWKMDRFGHLQIEKRRSRLEAQNTRDGIALEFSETSTYRFKLSKIAVRYEVKSGSSWVRLHSGYFSKLSITPDGKLSGLKR